MSTVSVLCDETLFPLSYCDNFGLEKKNKLIVRSMNSIRECEVEIGVLFGHTHFRPFYDRVHFHRR